MATVSGLAAPRSEKLTNLCLFVLLVVSFWIAAAQSLRRDVTR